VLQSNTVASSATYTMLVVCVLGIGFMLRFLIALVRDGREIRVGHKVRLERVDRVADGACEEGRAEKLRSILQLTSSWGVLRITNALTSDSSRENKRPAAGRPHIVMFDPRTREHDSAAKRRYR
jgi:hypothetical protein